MSRSQSSVSNTLLEGPTVTEGVTAAVFDELARPVEKNLLVVSYRRSPDVWLRHWRTNVGELPPEVGFVHVGETTRSSATVSSETSSTTRSLPSADAAPFVKTVSDPTDLTSVGVRASEYLETWDGNGRRTVVCFDSVTALLDTAALDRAFRFLHVFAGRIESVDGRCYYLLDPSPHDEQSLSAVRELADAVVDLDATRRD
ncbi:DUF7504 family protein [Halorussus aquaticus]|uniref:DUF835 domain-containing protein n=1 Tax=Halorussus aquaticus TaxID=2953748 RepID=A0ABD5PYX1_9EURY|nr:hypothetical protein [Halorussus aquaticus]